MYADLQGLRVNGGTVPHSLVLAGQVPDLVIVDRSSNPAKVTLIELTIPFDSEKNFLDARDKKEKRYRRLTAELMDAGYTVVSSQLEIGSRGVVSTMNFNVIVNIAQLMGIKDVKNLRRTLAKIALIDSYRIWQARKCQEWAPGNLIQG